MTVPNLLNNQLNKRQLDVWYSKDPVQVAAQTAVSLGAGMVGMAVARQVLDFQEKSVESGTGCSVDVGTFGGGGLPNNTAIPTLSLSLALVPIGLMAVAVFPPFVRCVQGVY